MSSGCVKVDDLAFEGQPCGLRMASTSTIPASIESCASEQDIPHVYDNEVIEQDYDVHMLNIADADFGNPNDGSDDELLLRAEEDASQKNFPKPIWFCRFIAEWPSMAFGLGVAGHIFIVATTVILFKLGYDVFPINFEELPVNLDDQPWIKRDLAWTGRTSYSHRVIGINFPTMATGEDNMEIVINAKSGNILTKSMMDDMKKLESLITSVKHYDDYCKIPPSAKTCIPPNSILRLFDASLSNMDPIFNDPNFTKIPKIMYTALQNNKTYIQLKYALPKDTNINLTHAFARMVRMIVPFDHSTLVAKYDMFYAESLHNLTLFMKEKIKPALDHFKDSNKHLDISYFNRLLFTEVVTDQVFIDLRFAIGSVTFIFCNMWFHTGTLMVTILAVISILSSFLATNLFYRYVLGFRYFGFFHVLSLFIILGIGADDLFVFFDTWKSSSALSFPSLAHRLSAAYRKSAMSMLVTSLTTMVAFASTASSHLLIMKSFGVFSAVLIIIDYISVIVFFPTVVIFYHVKIRKWWNTMCSVLPKIAKKRSYYCLCLQSRHKITVNFFKNQIFHFITHKKIKLMLLSFFGSVAIVMSVFCTRLQPQNGYINFLRSDEVFISTLEHNSRDFSDSPITPCNVYLVWGIEEQDISNCFFGDYKCKGIHRYDDDFNPNSQEAQISFQKLCNKLFSMTTEEIRKYRIQIDHRTGLPKIKCFARDIDQYLQKLVPPKVIDARLPWDLDKTKKVIEYAFPEYYNVFNITPSYDEYLNAAFNLFTIGNYVQNNTDVLQQYDILLGQMESPFTKTILTNPEIKVGNKFRYIAISVETDIDAFYMGSNEGIPLVEAWEGFMKDQLSTMPKSLQKGFQISPYGTWNFIYAQKEIQRNAVSGIILGLSLTTVILLISINNIITSLLAALTICMVTVCVIGMLPIIGWKLGTLVSMNMSLLVGISVDYIVHLAEGYTQSSSKDRKLRVRDSLESMGISVFAGACTTIGASALILFSEVSFFFQFAFFMFMIISCSVVMSIFFFMTLLGVVGPENDIGNLIKYMKRVLRCFIRKR